MRIVLAEQWLGTSCACLPGSAPWLGLVGVDGEMRRLCLYLPERYLWLKDPAFQLEMCNDWVLASLEPSGIVS